ncbi:Fimbrial assembly family protein [Methylocella silvestris BL2]|uniref:Fimbrial assembly family protein n=1 Tax=Methylocella silvestris (strain DSM 15510 / CIP 108128 / LMG 27833 / NCIMB 13906 / BL2) TaxID=395965 RepID=B8ESJ7_METSB|nr:PilN domain-containing protein [Methylocella silvestris]ACK49887.1 Fimbrial assembly family protein [Methylocella silvestris BL2]
MSFIDTLSARASHWLDEVAAAALAWRETLRPPRFARLAEGDDGAFTIEDSSPPGAKGGAAARKAEAKARAGAGLIRIKDGAVIAADGAALGQILSGARVEIVLRSDRFLFRPLYLPRRASDFLEGIIRAQIDRLTPWGPAEAAFGCLPSTDTAGDRMLVTVAATSRRLLTPFVEAIAGFGVETVIISTRAPDAGNPPGETQPVKIFEQKVGAALDARRLRRWLAGLLIGLGLLCAAALAVSGFATSELQSRLEDINRNIAQRRAALGSGDDPNNAAALALRQRKSDAPSMIVVYDELSRILPDDSYLTELRVESDKVQIVGVARDATGLIRLIEQSPQFTHAVFFAPTTRLPSDAGQHFFIEAHISPGVHRPEAQSQ